ncbi:MAG TPA: diphosphomevalonate decarboxylase [Woeseiaceae bacterium]|nr:diphosphomevalonate decarboxylase [Woeseiaceae bacterium]
MRATAQAQPNIALIKYWGKRDAERNLPAVGSLSLTLETLWTRMTVEFDRNLEADCLQLNGETASDMLPRISRCLDLVAGADRARAAVTSECNFPIAAGLASSASAFAALVVAASEAAATGVDTLTLARIAGAVSGSAARSLYPGIVLLTAGDRGIRVETITSEWPLELVVAVTDESAKAVGSGAAMLRSAATSPFYAAWVEQQERDIASALDAVRERKFSALAAVAEHNCLKMHSLTWTSKPPVVYWNEVTMACIQVIRKLQADGVPVFFTIDAGPQLKAVCLPQAVPTVAASLEATPGVRRILQSGLGAGAHRLSPG